MSRRNLWAMFLVTVFSLVCFSHATRNPYGRWFSQAIDAIESQYIEPVDTDKLFEGAMRGMVGRLDDYSSFLPRGVKTYFDQELEQKYGGIGIEVAQSGPDKALTVVNARTGMPAYRAGVQAGDTIVGIDKVTTGTFTSEDAMRLLRGKPGTKVTLRVRRAGSDEPLEFHLTRALIKIDSVLGDTRDTNGNWDYMLPGADRIGYIRVTSFGDLTVEEFQAAMQSITDRRCVGLVLDLRDNPGGLLQVAEKICDLFVKAGSVIVTTRGRDATVRDRYLATGNGPYQGLPLVVLVNHQSASASEIVAACLQDHDRAKIVGERSFGKGTVQNLIPVEAGKSSLKLTIATYWRPSDKNIHWMKSNKETDDWGVKPDARCEVKLDEKQTAAWHAARKKRDEPRSPDEPANGSTGSGAAAGATPTTTPFDSDPQLERAVQVLREQIAAPAKSAGA